MATLTIRRIDDDVKAALNDIAARDGRSVEGYVRNLIYKEVSRSPVRLKRNLSAEIHSVMRKNGTFLTDGDVIGRSEIQRDVAF